MYKGVFLSPEQDISLLIHSVERTIRREFAERLRPFGLTPQQAAVLVAIGNSRLGRLRHAQIALKLDADASTTSEILHRLERAGWIAFERHRIDGRWRDVELSAAGKYRWAYVVSAFNEASEAVTSMLSAADKEQLAGLLRRMRGW